MASQEFFRRQYLIDLPLPLAQLYLRTNDEKSDEARHNNCYFLFESLVKLIAAPAIALYLEEVDRDAALRSERLDKQLQALACPSQGHWVGILRELARHFSSRPGAEVHPLGHLWNELKAKRKERFEGLVDLYRAIKQGPDSSPSGDQSCSLMDVVDKLVPYRNLVLGHGAQQSRSFYQHKAPLFMPAVNDALQDELLGKLWPEGAQLIYIEELRTIGSNHVEMQYTELTGHFGVRELRRLTKEQADRVEVNAVALDWPNRDVPLRLNPLMIYQRVDDIGEVLFLNKDVRGKRVEYLSYRTAKTHKETTSMVAEMRQLLGKVTGATVSPSDHERLIEKSQSGAVIEEYVPYKPPTGRIIDDFEILVTLGKGGMGIVYLARQLSLGRLVALKMLPPALAGKEQYLARFRREIKILGQCEHPNVIKILAHGVTDNEGPYYAMEFVPGCDLNEFCNAVMADTDRPMSSLTGGSFSAAVLQACQRKRERAGVSALSPTTHPISDAAPSGASDAKVDSVEARTAASLSLPPLPTPTAGAGDSGGYLVKVAAMIRDAARALQHIHDREVIHRDIKPANLMLTADASRVVLMDFGLARLASSDLTEESQRNRLGTLRYMAPEQLQVREIDRRVDVRALGVILWELLARKQIFADIEEDEQLRAAILDQEFPRLRSIDASIPKDLEAIVSRTTELRPSDRIESATQLANYLDDFIQGRELTIRRRTATEKAIRFAKEHTWESGLAAGILLAIIGWAVTFTWLRQIAVAAEDNARTTVNEFFVEVSENELLNRPGMTGLRQGLLKKAKGYYEKFLESPLAREELLLEVGKAHYRIGVVTKDLDGHQAAVPHYEKALDVLGGVAAGERRDLFRSFALNRLGQARQEAAEAGRDPAINALNDESPDAKQFYEATLLLFQQSRDYFDQARAIRETLVGAYDNPEYSRLLANSKMNLGQLARNKLDFKINWAEEAGELDQLRPSLEKEFEGVEQELSAAQKIRDEQIAGLATQVLELKVQLQVLGNDTGTAAEQKKGLSDTLGEVTDTRQKLQRNRGMGSLNLGELYLAWGRTLSESNAREKYNSMLAQAKQATGQFEALRRASPSDTELQYLAALAYLQQGNATIELEQPEFVPLGEAAVLLEMLVRQNAREPKYTRELGRLYDDLGALFTQKEEPVAALHHSLLAYNQFQLIKNDYRDAFDIVEKTLAESLENTAVIFSYAQRLRFHAQSNYALGEEPSAYVSIIRAFEQLKWLQSAGFNSEMISGELEFLRLLINSWLKLSPDDRYAKLLQQVNDCLKSLNSEV